MSDDDLIGLRIGNRYVVERIIGAGGMGRVALGRHEKLGKRVAIKFLLEAVIAQDATVISRFLREAQLACELQSEHVVHVFDVGTTEEGVPYMVMEYLEGASLAAELQAGRQFEVAEATDLVLEALEAVAEAHAIGIVHRDLKPDNLFLARKGKSSKTVKVLDFGISKSVREESHALTQTSSLLGSPLYMSPEQIRAARDVTPRSDIWSIGVVLYELVEGRPPFNGASIGELFGLIQYRDPTPMTKGTYEFQLAVMKCLKREPPDRYADVAALAHAIQPFGSPASIKSVGLIEEILSNSGRVPQSAAAQVAVARGFAQPPALAESSGEHPAPEPVGLGHAGTVSQHGGTVSSEHDARAPIVAPESIGSVDGSAVGGTSQALVDGSAVGGRSQALDVEDLPMKKRPSLLLMLGIGGVAVLGIVGAIALTRSKTTDVPAQPAAIVHDVVASVSVAIPPPPPEPTRIPAATAAAATATSEQPHRAAASPRNLRHPTTSPPSATSAHAARPTQTTTTTEPDRGF